MTLSIGMLGVLIALAISLTTSFLAVQLLRTEAEHLLSVARNGKIAEFTDHIHGIEVDLRTWASLSTTADAIEEFDTAWSGLGSDQLTQLQKAYVIDNPHPLGSKDLLTDLDVGAGDGGIASYAATHSKYHSIFKTLKDTHHYYDVFLFNTNGDLIYSVYKELDYATNVMSGEYKDSGLGEAFRRALAAAGEPVMTDFSSYAPSHGAAASFMGQAVLRGGETIGALVYQMPVAELDAILAEHTQDEGESFRAFVVGADYLMRNNDALHEGETILKLAVETEAVDLGLAGGTGVVSAVNDLGHNVFEAYGNFSYLGVNWAFIAEIDEAEVLAPIATYQRTIVMIAVPLILLTLLGGWWLSRLFSSPIAAIEDAVTRYQTDNSVVLPCLDRLDEIGNLARAADKIFQKGLEAARLRAGLDYSANMVTLISRRGQILYVNARLKKHFAAHIDDFRQVASAFNPDGLIGEEASVIGAGAFLRVAELTQITAQIDEELVFGARTFSVRYSPVQDENGDRLGVVVDWTDITEDLLLQQEIARIVDLAKAGQLEGRVDLSGVEGSALALATGVNELVHQIEMVTQDAGGVLEAMAEGDLTSEIPSGYSGAFGALFSNLATSVGKIAEVVQGLQSAAVDVSGLVGNIQSDVLSLSERTEGAAASLEETAAATEELTATVKQNAKSATEAQVVTKEADKVAGNGADIVSQSVEAMKQIESSSNEVTDIAGVINDIAFQTNLLALNASVEAARAGEAGKGFAVVASEVRTLAQRCAKAADDVKELIGQSGAHVRNGAGLVNSAGETLTEIVSVVQKVDSFVASIATASSEQAASLSELSSTVSQMDRLTQENSEMARSTANSADSLKSLSARLTELTVFFRVAAANEARQAA